MQMVAGEKEVEEARRHLMRWLAWHIATPEVRNQSGLALRLGVSPPTITYWLKGEGPLPAFTQLLSISKELDVPLDILLRRDPPPTHHF